MSSVRSFWVVAMLCPGAFAVAFSEAARRSELWKGPVLVGIAAVLVWLGWLSGLEPWRRWSLRVVGLSTAFIVWDVLLSGTVYPGYAKDVDWTPAQAAELWTVALLGVGTVFLGTAVSRRLVRSRSVAATGGGLDRE